MKVITAPIKNRLTAARTCLDQGNLDALLISGRENNRYLSGFTGTESWLLITRNSARVLVDFRYLEQSARECPDYIQVDCGANRLGVLADYLREENCRRIGIEEDELTWSLGQQLQKQLPSIELLPAQTFLSGLRSVKDETEVAHICRAIEIAETALREILPTIRTGQTEIGIAARLEHAMRLQGASGPSFQTIIASGPRSAMPHGVATDRKIQSGDAIVIDFGCIWHGYCSDMTRTIFVGEPGELPRKIYGIVQNAQIQAVKSLHAGMTGQAGDDIARKIISAAGYGSAFGHGLGHGVGLAIHEAPRLSQTYQLPLLANQIVTVEPGIYLPGQFGIRIEDMLLVQTDGAIDLNSFGKDIYVLPV